MVTPYVIPADSRAFVLWRQAQPQLDPSIRLAAYVSLIVPLLTVLIGDVEGGITREEPARHQSKADGLSGHNWKVLGPRHVRVARGIPNHHVLLRKVGCVVHELGQAGDCLTLIGKESGSVQLAF